MPTFSFGEVDIYEQVANPPNSLLRKVQTIVKRITGVSPLIVLGRGFFQYSFGFLPQRKHIVQVGKLFYSLLLLFYYVTIILLRNNVT